MNLLYREIFLSYLKSLYKLIDKIELHAKGEQKILHARLAKNMLPLGEQARVAIGFSLRACYKHLDQEVPRFDKAALSFARLKSQISQAISFIEKLEMPDTLPENCLIKDKAGFNEIALSDSTYINTFALPNFFFHISMVYAIAKHSGVPVTKGDFDGIHSYPPGFSWEE